VFVKDEAKVASRGGSKEFRILESCLVSLMSKNSVLEEFRLRRFTVIQEQIC